MLPSRTDTTLKKRMEKKIFQANGIKNQAGVAVSIPDKKDFEPKLIRRDRAGHYILIKGELYEDITVLNIYPPDIGAPNFIKETLLDLKSQINPQQSGSG